jgi:hypothetical protein
MTESLHILTRLSARENVIEFCQGKTFKTYVALLCALKAAVGVDDCKDRSFGEVRRRVVIHGYIILSV